MFVDVTGGSGGGGDGGDSYAAVVISRVGGHNHITFMKPRGKGLARQAFEMINDQSSEQSLTWPQDMKQGERQKRVRSI